MESSLFRKQVLLNRHRHGSGKVLLKNVAPLTLLLASLLLLLVVGIYLATSNFHVYKERFVAFLVPSQSGLDFSSADLKYDAYVFIPEESIDFVVVGQLIQLKLAGQNYKDILPFEFRISEIISPEQQASVRGEDRSSVSSNYIALVPFPVEAVVVNGMMNELKPGTPLLVEMYTKKVTWLELFIQPLKQLTKPK